VETSLIIRVLFIVVVWYMALTFSLFKNLSGGFMEVILSVFSAKPVVP
jgi:hypothetical protein